MYDRGPTTFAFEGICLSVRYRGFGRKTTMVHLRNIMTSIGLELKIAYFLKRIYKLTFNDFKRKSFRYNKKRLYYLRDRMHRQSRVE